MSHTCSVYQYAHECFLIQQINLRVLLNSEFCFHYTYFSVMQSFFSVLNKGPNNLKRLGAMV